MESIFNDQYIKQYYYENILPNIVKEILTGKASGVKSINLESETNTSIKQNFHDNLLNIPEDCRFKINLDLYKNKKE